MKFIKKLGIVFLVLNILILMLFIVDLIPSKAVYENCLESVDILNDSEIAHKILCTVAIEDKNADASMLNMMINRNKQHVDNVLKPKLKGIETQQYLQMLNSFLNNESSETHEYIQYWHGYRILWTPLFVFLNINQVRIICYIVMWSLFLYLMYCMYKEKDYYLCFSFGVSSLLFYLISGAISLEYVPVIWIMLIASIYCYKKDVNWEIFALVGVCTAFFDYLTAETLTFTIPCFILLYKYKLKFIEFFKNGVAWVMGYLGTFAYKYLLLSLIYRDNYFIKIIEIYNEHFLSRPYYFKGSDALNMQISIFHKVPSWGIGVYVIAFSSILLFMYLFRIKDIDAGIFMSTIILVVVPVLRYIILTFHSVDLYYMTYRAAMIILLIVLYYVKHNVIFERGVRFNGIRKIKKA